jgi:mRNA interferase MazF
VTDPQPRRGNIVLVAVGVDASKPRPAAILQDDLFRGTDSVTVCPFTTSPVDAPLLRMSIPADSTTGIDEPSFAMVDKITTVRRSSVGTVVGQLNSVQMLELERRILVFLGLAH